MGGAHKVGERAVLPSKSLPISQTSRPSTLSSLPTEIHLEVISHLSYPDALALKLTNRHFQVLMAPRLTVVSRVTWLLERAQANLPIPKTGQLQLHSDATFLRNREVQRILRARRRHEECRERGIGCLIDSHLAERKVRFWESESGRLKAVEMFARLARRARDKVGGGGGRTTLFEFEWRDRWLQTGNPTQRAKNVLLIISILVILLGAMLAYGQASYPAGQVPDQSSRWLSL